jgi:hypothetical protein
MRGIPGAELPDGPEWWRIFVAVHDFAFRSPHDWIYVMITFLLERINELFLTAILSL